MSDYRDRNLTQNSFASPPDVPLMLRTHSEQSWLIHEVIPVVRQIETPGGLPEEQLPAAIAYLEVIWAEALGRARETDRALRQLDTLDPTEDEGPDRSRETRPSGAGRCGDASAASVPPIGPHFGQPSCGRQRHLLAEDQGPGQRHPRGRHSLPARVCRYHATVEALREATARRVVQLIAAPPGALVRELAPGERYAEWASSSWRR
jgi:hypothetical protein